MNVAHHEDLRNSKKKSTSKTDRRSLAFGWPRKQSLHFTVGDKNSIISIYENLYSPYNGSIIHNRKKDVKNLIKQSDYDNKISVTEWQSNPKDSD